MKRRLLPPLRRFARAVNRLMPGPRAVILAYHRVGESAHDPYGQAVSPATFARQLRHVRHRYQILSLHELLSRMPSAAYADGTIAITFDDGYIDTFTEAYPIAHEHDVPITVFVTTEAMIQGTRFWWDELVLRLAGSADHDADATRTRLHATLKRMSGTERREALGAIPSAAVPAAMPSDVGRPATAAELRQFADLPGLAVGSHTRTHPMLSALPPPEQAEELLSSKRVLEDVVGRPVETLAYPFGKREDVSRQTLRLASAAGYKAAFLTVPKAVRPSSNVFALPRLTVHEWPEEVFARRLSELLCEKGSPR